MSQPPASSAGESALEGSEPILERVRGSGLLVAGRPVLVLLSGGRDSVCLLEIAVRIAGPDAVRALHVNYGLREESDADERHCIVLCERLGVPIEIERSSSPPARGNVQAWARGVRYGAATRLAQHAGADVAVGHTATDQVEGVLYRLASAPSRRALLGMRERNGIVVRPLLGLTRAQTGAYCSERGLGWREDATNAEHRYARGRVRGELVPALRAIHPAAEANVLTLVEILRDEAAVLDSLLDDVLQGRREIELPRLRELPAALRRLVVQRLADLAVERPAPGIAARADELAALGERGTTSLDLGSGVRAVSEYGVLRFELVTEPAPAPAEVRLAVPGTVGFGAYEIRCEVGPPERRPGRPRGHQEPPGSVHRQTGRTRAPSDGAGGRVGRRDRVGRRGGDVGALQGDRDDSRGHLSDGYVAVRGQHLNSHVVDDHAIGDILVESEELQNRVRELAAEISRDYADRDLVLIGEGRDVLIVEDIVDSGLTLQYLLRNLGARNPRSLEVCALLTKPQRRKVHLPTRYVGFEIPNRFVIGYGLDHQEHYRNLPYVAALKE